MPLFPRRPRKQLRWGIAAGLLSCSTEPNAAAAAACGVIATFGLLAWLVTLDISMLSTPHGFGLSLVAVGMGGVVIWLTYLSSQPISMGVLVGAPLAAAALVLLQKLPHSRTDRLHAYEDDLHRRGAGHLPAFEPTGDRR